MKQILSTKKLSEQELLHARSLSQEVKCVDVIHTQGIPFTIPHADRFDSLAFTSTNGLKYFLANEQGYILLKYKTIFSISGKTKQTLTEQGFETAATAENAAQLAVKITQSTASSVLHPCSCTRLNDLETGLRTSAINYIPLPVYETQFVEVKIDPKEYDALLFFSPSGVTSFLKQNTVPPEVICCCIGETTAAFLQTKLISNPIIYPESPNAYAMLNLVSSHINFKHKHE